MRFNELRRLLDGITQKMLTQTLSALERDGLVTRAVYPTVPPRVEYGLTPLGVHAGRLTSAIAEWSVANVQQILAARQVYDEQIAAEPHPSSNAIRAELTMSPAPGGRAWKLRRARCRAPARSPSLPSEARKLPSL